MKIKKFVVLKSPTDGSLQIRFGMVELHCDLFDESRYKCIGRGKFSIDQENNTVELFDKSSDYGSVDINMYRNIHCDSDLDGYKIVQTYTDPLSYKNITKDVTKCFTFDL